jgi:hypothetical protein
MTQASRYAGRLCHGASVEGCLAFSVPFQYNGRYAIQKGCESMSKKRRSPRGSSSSRKQKRRKENLTSLVIPITVGLVVVMVIIGAIISAENRQPSLDDTPSSVSTAQALDTQSIPYPNVPRITLADTQKELEQGQAILVDVRSKSSYDSAHAAGAMSIPMEETNARLDELPRDKDIILYCT